MEESDEFSDLDNSGSEYNLPIISHASSDDNSEDSSEEDICDGTDILTPNSTIASSFDQHLSEADQPSSSTT